MARSSITPDQLLRIFDEAPSSTVLVSEILVNTQLTDNFWSLYQPAPMDRSKFFFLREPLIVGST